MTALRQAFDYDALMAKADAHETGAAAYDAVTAGAMLTVCKLNALGMFDENDRPMSADEFRDRKADDLREHILAWVREQARPELREAV